MGWGWVVAWGVLFLSTPAAAFEIPVQKLELLSNLSKAAERGDGERFRAYLRLLEAETSTLEKAYAVSLPEALPDDRLTDVRGALFAGWAALLAQSLAQQPDAPESGWRVVAILLSSNKEFIDQGDPDLYHKFGVVVSELRILPEGPERRALYADLDNRVAKLIAQTLKP